MAIKFALHKQGTPFWTASQVMRLGFATARHRAILYAELLHCAFDGLTVTIQEGGMRSMDLCTRLCENLTSYSHQEPRKENPSTQWRIITGCILVTAPPGSALSKP